MGVAEWLEWLGWGWLPVALCTPRTSPCTLLLLTLLLGQNPVPWGTKPRAT